MVTVNFGKKPFRFDLKAYKAEHRARLQKNIDEMALSWYSGKLVLKDFNIEDEAGGVNKPLRKNFTAVVTDSTLDIRFYWAGKGTIGIPDRGVYGQLNSAISVDPDFPPPSENIGRGISGGAIAGIVIVLRSFLVLFIL